MKRTLRTWTHRDRSQGEVVAAHPGHDHVGEQEVVVAPGVVELLQGLDAAEQEVTR